MEALSLSSLQSESQELLFHADSLAGPISNDHQSGTARPLQNKGLRS